MQENYVEGTRDMPVDAGVLKLPFRPSANTFGKGYRGVFVAYSNDGAQTEHFQRESPFF